MTHAQRQARYRQRQRNGERIYPVSLNERDIEILIDSDLLPEDSAEATEKVCIAIVQAVRKP